MLREFGQAFHKILKHKAHLPDHAHRGGEGTDENIAVQKPNEHVKEDCIVNDIGEYRIAQTEQNKVFLTVFNRNGDLLVGVLIEILQEKIGHMADTNILSIIGQMENAVDVITHAIERLALFFFLKAYAIGHLIDDDKEDGG